MTVSPFRVYDCGCIPARHEYCQDAEKIRMLEYATYNLPGKVDTAIARSIRKAINRHYVEQSLEGAYRDVREVKA